MSAGRARAAGALGLGLVALAGCGGSEHGSSDPFTKVDPNSPARVTGPPKAALRWEPVASLAGTGPATRAVDIGRGALQWRVRFRCDSGTFQVAAPGLRGRSRCPGKGKASSVVDGPAKLAVKASGRWHAVVDQQLDTALDERPLPAMAAPGSKVIGRGSFYPVERRGHGKALLYELRGGRLALRLQGFETSVNTDLAVWLSARARPRTTREALRSPHLDVSPLKSTLGNQNYLLPRSLKPSGARSVVIWCQPIRIAYTAASLER